MNVLFLAPHPPVPVGGGRRMYYMLKYLASCGVQVTLLAPWPEGETYDIGPLHTFCREVITVPVRRSRRGQWLNALTLKAYTYQARFKAELTSLLEREKFDLIHVEKFQMAEYVYDVDAVPVVVDLWATGLGGAWGDVRQARSPKEFLKTLFRIPRYALADRRYYRRFDNYMTVSEKAADFIKARYPEKRVAVVPVGVEFPELAPIQGRGQRIIFTGDMSFAPNMDAACHFVSDIFPLIRRDVPDAQFFIVGMNPDPRVQALANPDGSVVVTGRVADMYEALSSADVYACPLRGGSGMRNKLLEAFACSKAVVTTQQALEGIDAKSGKHVLTAETPQAFAEAVVRLLRDEDLARSLGGQACKLTRERYHWPEIIRHMSGFYQSIVQEKK